MLAATRNDDELRRKEAELALIKERAERDKREKEALEALRMNLENEKHRIEVDLEAERNLGLDKDVLLERSKQNELELEEKFRTHQFSTLPGTLLCGPVSSSFCLLIGYISGCQEAQQRCNLAP